MINDFYSTLFIIKRAVWTTDNENNPYSEEAEVGQFMGHIQQANAELATNFALTLTNTYSIWCPLSTNILAGDTIQSVSGVYSVKAVMKYENGQNRHIQAIVQLDEVVGS